MENNVNELIKSFSPSEDYRGFCSGGKAEGGITKVKFRPVDKKGTLVYQFEEYKGTQVFHKNVEKSGFAEVISGYLDGNFKEAVIESDTRSIHILFSKKGKATIKEKRQAKLISYDPSHNRVKNYLLAEGTPVPFLVRLGVMSEDGHVVKAKYDKFKQINRFLEFVDDIFTELPKDKTLTILDFGCGKSYLTFALYHYLKVMKERSVNIIGLDLKRDVIAACNNLAKDLGYDELRFLCGDIADYEGVDSVDMVVTLHACDTATDFALAKAVKWGASVILSVPCCQHELNRSMKNTELSMLFKYGIIKERSAALFTDAFRANILESRGFDVQLLEFIDMEHTPKNILIRAVRNGKGADDKKLSEIKQCMSALNADLTLYNLLDGE